MQVKKTMLIAGAVTSVGLASVLGTGMVSAATNSGSSGDSLISKIAQKFNLKESDVQAVFDEDKTARDAERQADMSDRLQDLVDNGKITAAQKTLIENKAKALQTARETERKALQAWADEQGIDQQYVMFGRRGDDSSDRLQKLVDGGKITAAQKTAIEAKQKELADKRDADQEALKKWADDNDIDERYLMMGGGRGHHDGPGAPGGF